MEREREWEEATLEEEVEESGALEVRQRRRRGVNAMENDDDDDSSLEEKRKVVEVGGEGGRRSVYYEKERGVWKCRHCTWTYQSNGHSRLHIQNHEVYCQVVMDSKPIFQLKSLFESPIKGVEITDETAQMKLCNEDQFAAEKDIANGDIDFRTKEFHGQEDIPVQNANNILKNKKAENGSKSQHYSEGYNENEITQNQHEIDGHKEIKIVKKSELKVSAIDLERVLDEQDTHDLFCPNCHSCITRRVILRKRKRSERSAEGTEPDAPAKKVPEICPDVDSGHVGAEMTDPGDREPDVFRCLSCFSFFIPTEGGFSIFRIFEKREENQNLQSSQQIPAKNMNWISSMFTSGTGKSGLETPKPGDSNIVSGERVSDSVHTENQSCQSMSMKPAECEIIAQKNDAGVPLPVESSIICEEQTGNLSLKGKQSTSATIIEGTAQLGQNVALTEKNGAGSTLPGEYYASGSRQMEDQSPRDEQSTVAEPVVTVTVPDNFQSNDEEKLSNAILNNDRGDDIDQVAEKGISSSDESICGSVVPAVVVLPDVGIEIPEPEQSTGEARRQNDWDVLKSIVYGGLTESITSLSVVSSAAGTDPSTLKIVALGLANLIGGLFVIVHDLFQLRSAQDEATDQRGEPAGRYWEVLGRRANFKLHATVAILSYLLFGIFPPLTYGFSFRESDNNEYKLIAVAAAGLLCISLLAIGKAHVKPEKAYIKYLLLYLSLGVSASGVSYVAGLMISRLLEKLGLFDSHTSASAPPSIIYRDISSTVPAWSSF